MNIHLKNVQLSGAVAASAMRGDSFTAEVAHACSGVPVTIKSAESAEAWAARLEKAVDFANGNETVINDLRSIVVLLRAAKWGAPAADRDDGGRQ